MLKWDGTEITHLLTDENVFIEETIYGENIYYRFVFKDKDIDIDNSTHFKNFDPIPSFSSSSSSYSSDDKEGDINDKGKEKMYDDLNNNLAKGKEEIEDNCDINVEKDKIHEQQEMEEIEEEQDEEMEEEQDEDEEEMEEDEENVGIVRTSTTTYPCLIDEIKPVFGLHKVGTHWFRQYNKIMILQKARTRNGVVIQELRLNDLSYHHERLEPEVRKIFTFRELLGMSKNHESAIILREFEDVIVPISFYEPGMDPAHKGKVIPESILKRWFGNMTIDLLVKKLLQIEKSDEMTKKLAEIRSHLEEIVNRVDKEQITFVDEILTRIRKRLQYILSP